MLAIEQLKVCYGKAIALDGISIAIQQGEFVALLGSNGAGKSTLLKTISGVLRPAQGRILWNGEPLHRMPPHQIVHLGIVQVPEGRAIFPELTVQENLRMGAFLRSDAKEISTDMDFIYNLFPRLWERQKQLAGTLSGGEAQMVAIARALLSKPRLLMMDEPSLGLAPMVRKVIFEVIQKIYQTQNISILLVEQNARWALQAASRAYILENGRIRLEGLSQDLNSNPHVRKAYLGY
ncbi:MAG: ABC transporter ATP-binding protein [Desulfobacterales bacterium]